MIIRSFSCDGLTPGPLTTAVVGDGDTPWSIVNGSMSVVYAGPRTPAIEMVKDSTVPALHWSGLGGVPEHAGRVYLNLSGAPSGTTPLISVLDTTDNRIFDLVLLSSIRFRLHDPSNAQVGSLPVMELDTWYRVEWAVTSAGVEVALYEGEQTASMGTMSFAGTIPSLGRLRLSPNSASVTLDPVLWDDIALSDEAVLIGPAGTPPAQSPYLLWQNGEYVPSEAYIWDGTEYLPVHTP